MQCPCNSVTGNSVPMNGVTTPANSATVGTYRNTMPLPGGAQLFTDSCTGYQMKVLPHVTPRPDLGTFVAEVANAAAPFVHLKHDGSDKTHAYGYGHPRQPCQRPIACPPERKTVCVEYPPRRKNCYKEDRRPWQQLYNDAFDTEFTIGPSEASTWSHFTNDADFTADDGKARVDRNGLSISAHEFKKSYHKGAGKKYGSKQKLPCNENGFLDHFKTFAILNSEFPVPDCGEIYAEVDMSGRTFGTEYHPFQRHVIDHTADLRLACCAFSMIDFESGLHIWFALTNDSLYAVYEVMPIDYDDFEQGDNHIKAAFAAAFWVARRNSVHPLEDFTKLGLAIDKRKGALWYYNGNVVHREPRLGALPKHKRILYQMQGEPKTLDVKCVHVGLGLFTMLDAFPPHVSPVTESNRVGLARLTNFPYVAPFRKGDDATFAEDCPKMGHLLWGQGASLKVKQIEVTLRC